MNQSSIPLAKRTKQEVLEAYEALKDQVEELRSSSQMVTSQPALDLVEKTKSKTPQAIDQVFTDFQRSLNAHLTELRSSLQGQASDLHDLQEAIEVSRQQLALHHHLTLAAESLDQLVDEHARRTAAFETDIASKKRDFEEQISSKKKIWERETEEYEYQKKLMRERDQVETEEREKALAARENTLRTQEQEIVQMKKTIEQFPKELEAVKTKCEQEITRELTQEFSHQKELSEKEASAQIRLLELTVKNLEERVATQTHEIAALKQQTEEANAKAQALAVKAIERPTTIMAPTSQSSNAPSSYNDRQPNRGNG